MKPALVAVLLLVTSSCAFGERSLPTARAILHWSAVDLRPAAWCWNFGNRGECADSPGAEVLLHSGDLKPYPTVGGQDALIKFDGAPALQRFDVDLQFGPGSPAKVTPTYENEFAIPMVPPDRGGVYVYAITGTWREGTVSYFLALRLTPGVA